MSPIANMLVQIRNAQSVGHEEVVVPFSKLKQDIAEVLMKAGFLKSVDKKNKKSKKSELPYLYLTLGNTISGARLISKPSRRMYTSHDDISKVRNGFGIAVMTTSKGVMTNADARKAGIGGEVMFEIW